MGVVPHATRTSLRRLLLRKGVDMPPVRELTLRDSCRARRAYGPAYTMRWRSGQGKHNLAFYYFRVGQPCLEVNGKTVPITMEEVQLHGLCKEKE